MERSRITRQQWESLNRCRHDSMRPLVELLDQAHTANLAKLTKADDPTQIYRLQGGVHILGALLDLIKEAPDRTR